MTTERDFLLLSIGPVPEWKGHIISHFKPNCTVEHPRNHGKSMCDELYKRWKEYVCWVESLDKLGIERVTLTTEEDRS